MSGRFVAKLVDSGWVPEPVLRAGIRAVCALRLREERHRDHQAFTASLRTADLAIETAAANAQHYEVPAAFFERVLGPHLKYSACYWPSHVDDLGGAEAAMLALYAERAALRDGQRVLDLGCGWGSFCLWAAARYPNSAITAISNSHGQRAFIERQATARGLHNLTVRTADVRTLNLNERFDRIVSIEMFEHMRNYEALFAKLARWLAPDGSLFCHVFAHHRYAYPFEDAGGSDWMAREFFTGGIMPSEDLFAQFDRDLVIAEQWRLDGTHYAKTSEAWYANLMQHRAELERVVGGRAKLQRWRVFFLACAELFGYRGGSEWIVAHYRMQPRPR
ncbi:MAG: cyclopropane-fatty-acyl-phospholipid synthase family protein [Deltaproteobacteria bacterium]